MHRPGVSLALVLLLALSLPAVVQAEPEIEAGAALTSLVGPRKALIEEQEDAPGRIAFSSPICRIRFRTSCF